MAPPKENSEMKVLRYVFVMMLVCALSHVARADDFKLGVLDAPTTTIDYTGGTLNVDFSNCGHDIGCVTIANDSGHTLTSLVIDFSAIGLTTTGNCLTGNSEIFTSCTESLIDNGTEYQFDFSGGSGIPDGSNNRNYFGDDYYSYCNNNNNTFTIEETGENPRDFGPLSISSTPEPASFWLLSTGVLLFGGFLYRRRLGLDSMGS
jgi:hypothetical protein